MFLYIFSNSFIYSLEPKEEITPLKLSIDGRSIVFIFKNAEYTITLYNDGETSVKDITLKYEVPILFKYLSCMPKGAVEISSSKHKSSLHHYVARNHSYVRTTLGETTTTVQWKLKEIGPKQKVKIKSAGQCPSSRGLPKHSQFKL